MRITITGTREVPEAADRCEAVFEQYLEPWAAKGHEFFVGGEVGVDTFALEWLIVRQAPVTIVVPATVDDQPAPARDRIRQALQACLADVVELRHPDFPEAEAQRSRDRYMVDRSALVIGCPLAGADGGATWSTLDYAASKGVPRLIVPLTGQPPPDPQAGARGGPV